MNPPPEGFVNEHQCELRHRLAAMARGEDHWWALSEVKAATEDVGFLLQDVGLPWLDRLRSSADIIDAFFTDGRLALGMHPAGPLHIALLLLDEGDTEQAERIVVTYLQTDLNSGHRKYLTEFLPKQGLGHLLETP